MPYIIQGKDSFREHSDIDVLVDVDYMDYLRTLLQEEGYYNPERDSINLGLDKDYGLKVFIDGVYVEFEPMNIENEVFTRKKSLMGRSSRCTSSGTARVGLSLRACVPIA